MNEYLHSPETVVTPQMLVEMSREGRAVEFCRLWYEGMINGQNTLVYGCGDARNWMLPALGKVGIVSNRAIGTTEMGDSLRDVILQPGIAQILVVGHYDGVLSAEKGKLVGCGALAAKDALDQGEYPSLTESLQYVHDHVQSPHVVVQTLRSAIELSRMGNKPVLAGVMDHRTGRVSPLAGVERRGGEFIGVHKDELSPNMVEDAIRTGKSLSIPTEFDFNVLDEDRRTREFIKMLQHNVQYAAANEATPDFSKRMAVQNPSVAVMSSSSTPLAGRYPDLFFKPNTCFALRLIGDGAGTLDSLSLKKAIAQMHYPISHKLNAQSVDASFGSINTIIIETTRESESMRAGAELCNRDWMKEWRKQGGRIIVAVVNPETGATVKAELYSQGL